MHMYSSWVPHQVLIFAEIYVVGGKEKHNPNGPQISITIEV